MTTTSTSALAAVRMKTEKEPGQSQVLITIGDLFVLAVFGFHSALFWMGGQYVLLAAFAVVVIPMYIAGVLEAKAGKDGLR